MNTVPLGEICEFIYGKSLPKAKREPGAYRVFGSNGTVGMHARAITSSPAIVVGRKGSIGQLNYSEESCWPIDTTYYVDETSTSQDVRWLYYALISLRLPELNKATGVPGLNRNDAYEKLIYVPPLKEQRRIVAILDKADSIRRKREQALALTDNLLKSTFLEMFGDPAMNTRNLPTAPIRSLGDVITGNTPPRSNSENYGDGIEWIKSDNINTTYHYLTPAKERLSDLGERICRKVPAGATLVTCIAGSPDCIGNAAMSDREVAFNQQINAVIPSASTDQYFLYAQILVAKQIIQNSSTNSMKGMVSKGKFKEIEFLAPDYGLQEEFGRCFKKILKVGASTNAALRNDHDLFSSLSQRAFRGEL